MGDCYTVRLGVVVQCFLLVLMAKSMTSRSERIWDTLVMYLVGEGGGVLVSTADPATSFGFGLGVAGTSELQPTGTSSPPELSLILKPHRLRPNSPIHLSPSTPLQTFS